MYSARAYSRWRFPKDFLQTWRTDLSATISCLVTCSSRPLVYIQSSAGFSAHLITTSTQVYLNLHINFTSQFKHGERPHPRRTQGSFEVAGHKQKRVHWIPRVCKLVVQEVPWKGTSWLKHTVRSVCDSSQKQGWCSVTVREGAGCLPGIFGRSFEPAVLEFQCIYVFVCSGNWSSSTNLIRISPQDLTRVLHPHYYQIWWCRQHSSQTDQRFMTFYCRQNTFRHFLNGLVLCLCFVKD